MKNIFLSVVVICALAIAGIGGTLAGWSDTEESMDNYISIGSLDLKVNGTDDLPWGLGIPALVTFEDIAPSEVYKVNIVVENHGEAIDDLGNPMTAPLYIFFKNAWCENVDPACGTGYEDPAGRMKPEPELVAEYGGVLAQVNILGDNWSEASDGFNIDYPTRDAVGVVGDNCSVASHVTVTILYGPVGGPVVVIRNQVFLEEVVDTQVYLGELPQCGADYLVTLEFHLPNRIDEGWPEDHWPEKFADWPTNGVMLDRINFNIMFELLDYNSAVRPII